MLRIAPGISNSTMPERCAPSRGLAIVQPALASLTGQVGDFQNPFADRLDTEVQQQLEALGQSQEAGHVGRTPFVALALGFSSRAMRS